MWASIQNIEQPATLLEANKLNDNNNSVLFSGGTYLVAQKSKEVHTLIDINHLITSKIEEQGENISIGAGATLQQISDHFTKDIIGRSTQQSCYSKNIRNQRTIGGEIAQKNATSEISVLLHTMNAKLKVFVNDQQTEVAINEWDGKGIITEIIFAKDRNANVKRYSVIPSAPPFVVVGYNYNTKTCVVGGRTNGFVSFAVEEDKIQEVVEEKLADFFVDDHHGSSKYKRHLVKVALRDFGSEGQV